MSERDPNADAAASIAALLTLPGLHPDTAELIRLAHEAQTVGTPLDELVAQLPKSKPQGLILTGLILIGLGLGCLHPALAFIFCGLVLLS